MLCKCFAWYCLVIGTIPAQARCDGLALVLSYAQCLDQGYVGLHMASRSVIELQNLMHSWLL